MHRLLVLGALLLGLVMPLSAQASGIPTTGTRIGLLAPPSTFAADTPFYVTQGFTCEASKTDCLSGLTHFDLYVDGQQLPSATDLTFGADGTLLSKFNLTNFPIGLSAGTHVFRGDWYYLGGLVLTQTVTIDFV
jgi:hypothetical protein